MSTDIAAMPLMTEVLCQLKRRNYRWTVLKRFSTKFAIDEFGVKVNLQDIERWEPVPL